MDAYDRLGERMAELGLIQADICRALSMDSGQLSRAIGAHKGLESKWPYVVRILKTSLDWLVLGQGEKEPAWLKSKPAEVLAMEQEMDQMRAELEHVKAEIREIAEQSDRRDRATGEGDRSNAPPASAPRRSLAPVESSDLEATADAAGGGTVPPADRPTQQKPRRA